MTIQNTLNGQTVTVPNHVLGMTDLQGSLTSILAGAKKLKNLAKQGPLPPLLAGKTVILLFQKNSTRTRISFEVGIQKLGGIVSTLDAGTSQLGRGESLEDTAGVLSRYADALVFRANTHADVTELAEHATVPVVNALTDLEHPCQILADLQALEEAKGDLTGKTFCYVGDGNNMCHSYMLGAILHGMNVRIATPSAYAPDAAIVEQAEVLAHQNGVTLHLCNDPQEAVQGADAVATDTWISMGDESEAEARLEAFQGYLVDDALMDQAAPGALFLHCLPGHWGDEATHELAHGPRSLIWDEAENRMWAQMSLLCHLLGARI